ncbi:calcium-translocating P-type ATPase, PMCA-type family protein [Histomonas meleagridis]|uniref:calcium-translocating P-type ATPase, PMCA-type family protein n=1 Tax=Histomonas meleagridis TaxID=135588 RepID=UPI003559FDED|nr:calcium-translocating P-type ATPase, PMCA-type family protein [Histomonas meleagridis]KAH0798899.1 calcium-translocating P-type ATPase, PMCA-type family protein [Histomonas meleagridis]
MKSITIDHLAEFFERGNASELAEFGGIEGLVNEFQTDLHNGISATEEASGYKERKEKWGVNIIPDPPTRSWCGFFLLTFKDLMLKILVIISLISIVLTAIFSYDQGWVHFIDPVAILLCSLIVSCVTAQINYTQQKAFIGVSRLKNEFLVNVIRAGEEKQILSTEILVGDILSLKNGDAIPVDGIYISGHAFYVDNSQTTGESVPIRVNEQNPVVFSGTAVDSGDAMILVCAVGNHSQSGITMLKLNEISSAGEKTPLEKKLDDVAVKITYMGLVGAILTFVVLLILWIRNIVGKKWERKFLTSLMDNLMVSFTIFIGAVPEGLPLAVVISLGFSMKKMMRDNNFVRNMSACETMGGATTICSDKTGTLTQNKMTVVKFYMDGQDFDDNPANGIPKEVMNLMADSIACNTNAYMTVKPGDTKPSYVGKSTECALLQMITEAGYDYKEIRELHPTAVLHDFNSTRKRMSSVVPHDNGYRVYAKGAPEILIKKCTHYINLSNEIKELDEVTSEDIIQRVNEFADDQLRTMLITYGELEGTEFDDDWNDPANVECNLIVIGVCGIRDPLRPEVPHAIEQCKQAGVLVRMVTGDNINTAVSIARQCGILTEDGHAMLGKEFSSMSKVQLIDRLPKLQVLARSSPLDKYRLVSLLMECGEVVAVTGDGSNDSTALRKANVGLAMGQCGTELAKMASDIVILDDNFNSIVSALKWGRCIYDNVRSFLQFQLTVNVCALIISFVGSCILQGSPFRAIQLLWVSLIMDSIGALALATKGPIESLLDRPPYGESGALISRLMYRNIIVHALWQTGLCLLVLFGAEKFFELDTSNDKAQSTFLWNTFVFCQVFNLLNSRVTDQSQSFFEGFFSNPYFWGLFVLIVVVQVILVEFGGDVFGCIGLGWKQWLYSVGFALTELIVGAILRLIPIHDDTSERLIVNREKKREIMRRRYTGMTPSMMWRAPDVPDDIPDKKDNKKKGKDKGKNDEIVYT